jgi:predicted nucleic acid-binding protein
VIVLDASVLIALLDGRDSHHARAVERLVEWAHEPLACSSITLAEVLVAPARAGRMADAQSALATLGVEEVQLPVNAAARLALLRGETGLKLPDCCVLLAAESAGAPLLTFYERLARAAASRGLGSPD